MKNIAFITGAGVSTPSGIPDFKTVSSNWQHELPREEILSTSYFKQNPEKFWEIYRTTFIWKNRAENAFHQLPRHLAQSGMTVDVLTQNVDGLHGQSLMFSNGKQLEEEHYTLIDPATESPFKQFRNYGQLSVWEAHGNASQVICQPCKDTTELASYTQETPQCEKCGNILKPNIALFGENINHYNQGIRAVINCDLLIVAGTSLDVGPVNHLPHYMNTDNMNPEAKSVWVNTTPPPASHHFDETYIGDVTSFAEEFETLFLQ